MMVTKSIPEFFRGQKLLITGASGLMGKVLIWKLLYSCPDVDTIFILLRPKYGKPVEARLEEMLKTRIFNKFWNDNPKILRKIVAITGDVSSNDLGLSAESKEKLLEEVTVIFHVAATLKLDANLKDAVNMNTEGTWRLLQLSCEMKNLVAFVHTSTAYCHCDVPIMEERVYKPPEDPKNVMNLVHWMDRDVLHEITDKIISPHPNTYTYSKRLAEKLVADFYPRLPIAIARPSIVIPSWKEPLPGWVDNLNGPVGIMIGAGKGVIRTMLCNPDYNAEVIPVDLAINGLLAIAWKTGTTKPENRYSEIPVYNLTQSDMNPMKWGEVVEKGKTIAHEYPFEMTLWYPGGNIRSNKFVHNLIVLFFHWIPAYLIDFIMLLIGQKRFMVRVQQKIHDGLRVLQYFTTHQWKFRNTKLLELRESMNESDKEAFSLAMETINPELYMIDCVLGARHYCLKEDPASIPKCRRNMKM
ncbi:hypothetical protein PGB90_007413 [Kerria lacca]